MQTAEIRPGNVFVRRLKRRGPTWRQVLFVHSDGTVIYKRPSGARGECRSETLLKWADGLNRVKLKEGPLL